MFNGPNMKYCMATGAVLGLTGGVLSIFLQPWLAWGIAGVASGVPFLPAANRKWKRGFWRLFSYFLLSGIGAGLVGQIVNWLYR